MGKVKKAGDLLSELLKNHFDEEALETGRKTAGLYSSWAAIATEARIHAASDHSRIREFEHGVLVIEAEHPGWVQLLQTKQNILLNILQARFPDFKIHGVSFCLSKAPISRPSPSSDIKTNQNENEPALYEAEFEAGRPENKAMYEQLNKFKDIIQKRNSRQHG